MIIKQMAIDVSFLSQFDLMDYSLLFVIAFNPEYIKKYPEKFQKAKNGEESGELAKPYKLVQNENE